MHIVAALALYLWASAPAGRIPESIILGDWCAGSKNAFHEVFSLEINGQGHAFHSWLHEKPALEGLWQLRGRELTIRGANEDPMVYKIITASKRRLVMRELNRSDSETYVRMGHCVAFENPTPERSLP